MTELTPVTLSAFLVLLTKLDPNVDLRKLDTLLTEAEANPALWTLPAIAKLQPYKDVAKEWIPFLLQLDTALTLAVVPVEPPAV